MKLVKMLGLAALAALATMAFVGATSASADTLCLENVGHEKECPAGKRWEGNVWGLTAVGSPAVLLEKELKVSEECKSEVLGLFIENEGAHKGVLYLIDKEGIKFVNCEGPCNKATSEAPAWLLGESLPLDVWTIKHGELKPSAVLSECTFGITCLYAFPNEKTLLLIKEDLIIADHVKLEDIHNKLLCPNETFWDATYLVLEDEAGGKQGAQLYLAALP